jgi:hypothetical protein
VGKQKKKRGATMGQALSGGDDEALPRLPLRGTWEMVGGTEENRHGLSWVPPATRIRINGAAGTCEVTTAAAAATGTAARVAGTHAQAIIEWAMKSDDDKRPQQRIFYHGVMRAMGAVAAPEEEGSDPVCESAALDGIWGTAPDYTGSAARSGNFSWTLVRVADGNPQDDAPLIAAAPETTATTKTAQPKTAMAKR